MTIADTLRKAIPSPAASAAVLAGTGLTGFVWSETFEKAAVRLQWVQPDQLPDTQLTLSLSMLALSAYVALFLLVRAYRRLEREHAEEIARLKAAPQPAAAPAVAMVTRRTRRELLGDDPASRF